MGNVVHCPLTQHEGHLLIDVEGRRYLVDTGSPWSIGPRTGAVGGA